MGITATPAEMNALRNGRGNLSADELIAAIKEGDLANLKPVCAAVMERYGPQNVNMALAMMNESGSASNPFERGFITAAGLPDGVPPTPIHFGLYPRMVTMLNGETGAGKTAALYSIALAGAMGRPLFGFEFAGGTGEHLRILYVDPENSGSYDGAEITGGLCALRIKRLGMGKPESLVFHHGLGVDLSKPSHMAALTETIRDQGFQIVILDPIANLFATKDENDNAEAARQSKALTELSRETGACVVAVHHTGKDSSGNYGRGASARLAAADVGIVFRTRGSADDRDDTYNGATRDRDDVCRLQIVKDRAGFFGKASKYLRMAGQDRFAEATFEEWLTARPARTDDAPNQVTQAADEIRLLLADGSEIARTDMQDALRREGIGRNAGDEAIRLLVAENVVVRRSGERNRLFYKMADAPNQNPDSSVNSVSRFPGSLSRGETGKLKMDDGPNE